MNFLFFILYEIYWYGLWWLPFIAIAYSAARYRGWLGILGGVLLISGAIMFIDMHWIFDDMHNHPENERDADGIFMFGVLCRIVLFNLVLLPATITGLKLRARHRRIPREPVAA